MSTVRQQIIAILSSQEQNAMEISQGVSIREKEVYEHLEHISRSLAASGKKLRIQPYACLSCGYVFKVRNRFKRPGRCPQCKESHIRMATYHIEG